MREPIPDLIIDRAVELWCRALRKPKFDNGDRSFTGFAGSFMMTKIADHAREKIGDLDVAIEKFREALSTKLKFLRDNDGKPLTEEEKQEARRHDSRWVPEKHYFDQYLSVDYHPCAFLREAGEVAGIDDSLFSIKSSIWMDTSFVQAQFGYAAERVYHYPLDGGRWLVTSLSGSDIAKVVDYVNGGRPEFTVEA